MMPDFFANDATIDASNVDQYADMLPAGAIFMIKTVDEPGVWLGAPDR